MTALRKVSGAFIVLFALMVLFVSTLSFIDPKGTKMADDNDPFGEPPSRLASVCVGAISLAIGIGGLRMIQKRRSNPRE
jgi:uncharacterized membrane protein YfcA